MDNKNNKTDNDYEVMLQLNDDTPESDKERATRVGTYLVLYIICTILAFGSFKLITYIGFNQANIFLRFILGWLCAMIGSWVISSVLIFLFGIIGQDIPFFFAYLIVNAIEKIINKCKTKTKNE